MPTIVQQTNESTTVVDIPPTVKQDILRIQEKLDAIQPRSTPSLEEIESQLKQIKSLLDKNGGKLSPSDVKQLSLVLNDLQTWLAYPPQPQFAIK